MDNLLEGFNIWNLISTGSVGVAVYFFQKYNSLMEQRVNNAVARISALVKSNELKESSLRESLDRNMDAMGKTTKAVNGDMLKIEKSVFAIRKEINSDIEFLKNKSSDINRSFKELAQRLDLSIEAFDERYGRFVQVGERLKESESKIFILEKETGKVHTIAKDNTQTLVLLERSLKNMLTTIKQLSAEVKGRK